MYIAIDVGGTNIRIATSQSFLHPLLSTRVEYTLTHNFTTDYERMIKEMKNISSNTESIGISFPGDWTGNQNKMSLPTHNSEWANKPFVKAISSEFTCPVYIENDAVAGALGTAQYGGIDGNFIYITWGTGIGGAQVARVGDTVIAEQLDWSLYLKRLEDACGGANVNMKYGKTGDQLSENEWQAIINDFANELKIFIYQLHPTLVVVGGGIVTKQKARLMEIKSEFDSTQNNGTKVSISILGDDAGLYGALELIRRAQTNST
ncbi:MAG: ROK family protein [Candidatus Roizmanbacteria bacterium]